MAQPPTTTFGDNVLGKLRFVGGKVGDLGARVVDLGGTGLRTVGNKLVDVAGDVKASIFDNEFDKVRHINQLLKQHAVRAKFTEEELAAVEARADETIGKLPTGYFDKSFDPVAHELKQLGEGDNQEEIDAVVERLTLGVETVSGKLARHVSKRRDKLLEGVDLVATVEEGIKAAYLTVRSSRSTVKAAADEVARNMRVADQTRRKQAYIKLREILYKIQGVRSLQRNLKRAQELGEYQEAILLCMQCFKNVDDLSELTVAADLRSTVQRQYVDTLRKMDGALTNVCTEFDAIKYTKILEGYTLQGLDGKSLGEKVVQCFKESVQDVTIRVVRALLLTKPKLADRLAASSALEASYGELCRSLPTDLLRPCLLKLLQVLYDVLASYHAMARWHVLAAAKQEEAMAEAGGTASKGQVALAEYLSCAKAALAASRGEVVEAAARRIKDLLGLEYLFKGEDFLQITDWCAKFTSMCEAFCGGRPPQGFRNTVMASCARFLPVYHRSGIEALATCLSNEQWQDVGMALGAKVESGVLLAALQLAAESAGSETDFDVWIKNGNPFKFADGSSSATPAPKDADGAPPQTPVAGAQAQHQHHLQLDDASTSVPAQGQAKSQQQQQQQPGASPSQRQAPLQTATLTISSQVALKYVKHYMQLLKPLHPAAGTIFAMLSELYNAYLLAIFFTFGGMSLEDLVWRDDLITPRLKNSLIRVLAAEGSRFRLQVEELMRHKPQGKGAPIASTGMAFLDRFGDKMESLADRVERHVNRFAMASLFKETKQEGLQVEGRESSQLGVQPSSASFAGGAQSSFTHSSSGGHGQVLAPGRESTSGVPGTPSSAGGHSQSPLARASNSGGGQGPDSHHGGSYTYGLQERMVAVESLVHIAEELRQCKQLLMSQLSPTTRADAEQFYRGPIEAAGDLKDCLFLSAARMLMGGAWDMDKGGVPGAIKLTNYNISEPPERPSAWVEAAGLTFARFSELLSGAALSQALLHEMWAYGTRIIADGLLDGLAMVRKCTLEGRTCMSLDLNTVERQLREVAPPTYRANLTPVVAYIQAFYFPWTELVQWCQAHLVEYGRQRMFTLVEVAADFNKVKRQAKNEVLELLDAQANAA